MDTEFYKKEVESVKELADKIKNIQDTPVKKTNDEFNSKYVLAAVATVVIIIIATIALLTTWLV